jgi:hypothetical protein
MTRSTSWFQNGVEDVFSFKIINRCPVTPRIKWRYRRNYRLMLLKYPFSFGIPLFDSTLTIVSSDDAGKEKVCIYALLSSLVVSVIVYPLMSFIYQQDKNDYNNKKIPLVRYSTEKGNGTEYRLTNKVLLKTINQHKSRITRKQKVKQW